MAKWKLCFVLFLPLTVCLNSEVTLVKTIGREPDTTPVCSHANMSTIIDVICKIKPERSGEECRLEYRYGRDFEYGCDSRFTLMVENQTVFLLLTGLTPVDSGNYTCECLHHLGAQILHLNINVEVLEEEDTSTSEQKQIATALIGAALVTIIAAVIFGFIYRSIRQGRAPSSLPHMEPEDIEPYSTFIQRENGLYSTTRVHVCYTDTALRTTSARFHRPEGNNQSEPSWSLAVYEQLSITRKRSN